jgi:hypothetical protein
MALLTSLAAIQFYARAGRSLKNMGVKDSSG